MLTINTNLSSLIAQQNIKTSTSKLNQAIERMTTGFKINHASDNAANYSISTNMTTKINSYMVAEDNAAMGLDMTTAISENLDLINQHASRIRDLCEQASNGTYGEESLKAIQAEIESRMTEIERIKANAEFNGIKLFEAETDGTQEMRVTGSFIEEVTQLTEEEAIAQGYTIIKTADELQAMQDDLSGKYILMNDIDLAGYDWTPVGTGELASNAFKGELNGNGFVIKNLNINTSTESYQGLFGNINGSGSMIKNLGIEDANVYGRSEVGILVGYAQSLNIQNVYATGVAQANASDYGYSCVGGLVGVAASVTINNCYTKGSVSGSGFSVGGIVGINYYTGANISNSYSMGVVQGTEYVGGIIGGNSGYASQITDSYTFCDVIGSSNYGSVVGYINSATFSNVYYAEQGISGGSIASGTGSLTSKTQTELQAMIDNGTLVSAKAPPPPPIPEQASITLQVGISSDSHSQILMNLVNTLTPLSITVSDSISARDCLTDLDTYLSQISDYQTEIGAVQNRLESVLEEITIQRDNLISSRSTIRDADIAEVSSHYIQQQILQQASATLLATANQSPAIALQLI